jgi:photosystem II stability/assembly factor-like uncharacterized protein
MQSKSMKTYVLMTLGFWGALALVAPAQTISNPGFELNSLPSYPGYISGNGTTVAARAAPSSAYTNSLAYQRWRSAFEQRAYPLGYIPAGAFGRALKQTQEADNRQAKKAETQKAQAPKALLRGDQWVNIGPESVAGPQVGAFRPNSGRVDAIAADPGNFNHWLVGACNGGIWESLDSGTTWTPKTDSQPSLAMGALAFAPTQTNVVYAGTGAELFVGGGYAGAGLLKSTDGGVSWQLLASSTFSNASFARLKVNQTNVSSLLAATVRGFYGFNGESPPMAPPEGILKSTDGGTNWSIKLVGQGTALEVDPGNFERQYAGLGDIVTAPANGVYRSLDGGDTWAPVAGPWFTATGGVGRVEIALAPSDPNTVYVSIMNAFGDEFSSGGPWGGLLGLWRTTNAWDSVPSWFKISVAATDDGSGTLGYCGWAGAYGANYACWFAHVIIVDPANPNILYAGGAFLWKFDGTNWTEVSKQTSDPAHGIHADQHSLGWVGGRLIVGNDGGLWSTTDGGNTWDDHNTTLSTHLCYKRCIESGPAKLRAGRLPG